MQRCRVDVSLTLLNVHALGNGRCDSQRILLAPGVVDATADAGMTKAIPESYESALHGHISRNVTRQASKVAAADRARAQAASKLIVPGGRVCTVVSPRFAVIALRPEVGPLLHTESDFDCVEHRARLAAIT